VNRPTRYTPVYISSYLIERDRETETERRERQRDRERQREERERGEGERDFISPHTSIYVSCNLYIGAGGAQVNKGQTQWY
jgi:hypothetical protein